MTPQRGPAKHGYPPHDHYIEVTNRIIAALEAGTPPWRKPWDSSKTGRYAGDHSPKTGSTVVHAAAPCSRARRSRMFFNGWCEI